ncbi:MAG: hypothetical protein LBK58_02505, partial [Prevotellaceae bacterium]|nr:hypothetical protein [Prevotellaceae bacterium]
ENFPENNSESLKRHFDNLINGYAGNIDLRLAAEYMLDGSFNSHLENSKNKPLAIADEHLLVETSYLSPPLNFHQTIKKIKKKGYSIILAHPERYLYMDRTTTKTESRRLSVFSAESSFSDRILRQTGSEKCGISSQYSLESHRQAFKIKSLTAKLTDRINVLIENNRQLFQLKFS